MSKSLSQDAHRNMINPSAKSLEILKIYFSLKTKKFDKKVVVDKSTYRPEWVNLSLMSFPT